MEKLLTVKELCQTLKIGSNLAYKLLNKGLIDYLILGKKKILASSVDEFLRTYKGQDVNKILEEME